MKTLIKIEEVAQFIVTIVLFNQLPFVWWIFPAVLLLPDLSMIGYAISNKAGAFCYNLFHHKALAVAIGLAGYQISNDYMLLAGVILYAHSSMDRMFGYGLKGSRPNVVE
ncbi:MAG TPA: DUF4260 domain-containing protein [Dyadobacter sp.]|jgi:hypothetical protein|nr:DUF4260 domain-containing protein [Dyadobacter sp.]